MSGRQGLEGLEGLEEHRVGASQWAARQLGGAATEDTASDSSALDSSASDSSASDSSASGSSASDSSAGEGATRLAAARRQLLGAVESQEFVPVAPLEQAWQWLQRSEAETPIDRDDTADTASALGSPASRAAAPRLPEQYLAESERDLESAIQIFALQIFELPSELRIRRWNELLRQAAVHPVLRHRLERLGSGLRVNPQAASHSPAPMPQLSQHLCELYRGSPHGRAARRREMLASIPGREFRQWRRAAARLRRRHPELAALDPPLVAALAGATRRERRVQARDDRKLIARSRSDSPSLGSVLTVVAVVAVVVGGLSRVKPPGRSGIAPLHRAIKPPPLRFPAFTEERRKYLIETPEAELRARGEMLELLLMDMQDQRKLFQEQRRLGRRSRKPRPPLEVIPDAAPGTPEEP